MTTEGDAPATLEAPIAAVTVYRDRARVVRRGQAALAAGVHYLQLAPLPLTLEEQSVRAGGFGADARILGVEVLTEYFSETPEAEVAALEAHLEMLQDRERALHDSNELAAQRTAFLKLLRENGASQIARGLAHGRTELDGVRALAEYLWVEEAGAQARRRELIVQQQTLAREIQAVQARLSQGRGSRALARRAIRLEIEAQAATTVALDVSYMVGGAGWEPVYDLRLLNNVVEVGYQALVRQHTGEAWPAVALALSTARPARTTMMPELHPWYLDIPRPLPPPMPFMAAAAMAVPAPMPSEPWRDDPITTEAPAVRVMEALPPPPPPMVAAEAAIESSGATVTFRIERPVAVPPDGTAHKTTITTLRFDAQLDHVIVPKLAEEAYLRARVTNSSEATLLPGHAALFHGDEYVGSTRLDTVAPSEEFELQLGVDDRLKVERELVRRGVNRAFIGNVRRTSFAYRIALSNLLPHPAHVVVFDQMPVGRHEEIKVKLDDVSPRPTEVSELGILKWELDLAPGESRELLFGYTVEHPRQHDLPL